MTNLSFYGDDLALDFKKYLFLKPQPHFSTKNSTLTVTIFTFLLLLFYINKIFHL